MGRFRFGLTEIDPLLTNMREQTIFTFSFPVTLSFDLLMLKLNHHPVPSRKI